MPTRQGKGPFQGRGQATQLQLLPAFGLIAVSSVNISSSYSTSTIGSGQRFCYVLYAPKTGNIDRVAFRTETVTDSQTLKVGLQDVSLVTGLPDGVFDQSGTVAAPQANTIYTVALDAARAVTRGDFVAVVIEFDGTPGTVRIAYSGGAIGVDRIYPAFYNGTSWTKISKSPICSLVYDDNTVGHVLGGLPACDVSTVSFDANDSPDEIGNIWRLPLEHRVSGIAVKAAYGAVTDWEVRLYDGVSLIASASPASQVTQDTGGSQQLLVLFATDVILYPDVPYCVTLAPLSANNVSLRELAVPAAMHMDALPFGQTCHRVERTDSGAWSETATKRPLIYPIVSGIYGMGL